VSLDDRGTVGYEILTRDLADGLHTPKDMFLAAAKLDVHVELSRKLRAAGVEEGAAISDSLSLFLNAHPAEIVTPGLIESLRILRAANGRRRMTLEVREPSIADTEIIRQLSEALKNLEINLAYDDFGSGMTRRIELAAVRPDYVKFGVHLIRDIHMAPAAQHRLLANLVRMVRDLAIVPIALGVDCEAEHGVCCDMGFELGQGHYYGQRSAIVSDAADLDAEYAFL
jgi:EAL domain-containing protein (putative c-di-GMP-specific phosphodiesterase class I)